MRTDTFISLEPGNLPGADSVFLDQGVLGNTFVFHCFP